MKKGIVLSIALFTMFTSILLNIDNIGCFKGVSNKSNYEMIESVSAVLCVCTNYLYFAASPAQAQAQARSQVHN